MYKTIALSPKIKELLDELKKQKESEKGYGINYSQLISELIKEAA